MLHMYIVKWICDLNIYHAERKSMGKKNQQKKGGGGKERRGKQKWR